MKPFTENEERKEEVYRKVLELGTVTPQTLAEALGWGEQNRSLAYHYLQKLVEEGKVRKQDGGVYTVSPDVKVVQGISIIHIH